MSETATAQDLTDELIAGWPPGVLGDLISLTDPAGPGPLLSVLGELLRRYGTAQVDALRLELSPLTCSVATLATWEAALELDLTRIAQQGTPDLRRRQVLSRLRQWGAATRALVRAVVYPYLAYAAASDVRILEVSRDALRLLHTYTWTGSAAIVLGTSITRTLTVRDSPRIARGGVQVDLTFSAPTDLARLGPVDLTAPSGDSRTWGRGSIGRGLRDSVRLYAPAAEGQASYGDWSVSVTTGSNTAVDVTEIALFAEAAGVYLDWQGVRHDGRGAQIFEWGPVVEPNLQVSSDYDLDAADLEVQRLSHACRRGTLLRRPLDLNVAPPGDLGAVVDDDWCICDLAVAD